MTSKEILEADMLDILFDNRNKQYGAYMLRKNYNNRLGLSLGLGIGGFLVLFLFLQINPESSVALKAKSEVHLIDLIMPPEKMPELPKPKLEQVAAQSQVPQRMVVDRIAIVQEKPVNLFPDMTKLDGLKISDVTMKGLPGNGPSFLKTPGTEVSGGLPVTPEPEKEMIQREPEFPGGMQAWINFLNKHLTVPDELQAGEKKTVLIRFLVASDGAVTGFEVLQSSGKIYDNEVIRVLKRMPKWKPAIQNNLPVSRQFTQPVTFMGLED